MTAWWHVVDLTYVTSSAGIIQVAQMILCLMAFVCVQASEWCRKVKDICETIPDTYMLRVFLFINMGVVIATIVGYLAFTFGLHKKLKIKNWNLVNAVLGCCTMIILLVAICFLAANIGVYISGLPGITAGLCIDFVAFVNAAGYVYNNVNEMRQKQKAANADHGETMADGGQAVFTGGLSAGEGEDFLRPEGEPTLSAMRTLSSSRNMKDCYEVDLSGGRTSKLGGASVSSAEKRGSVCSSDSSRSFENAVELVITEATPVHSS